MKKNTKIIILGDFNDIRNNDLDQSRIESKRSTKLPIISWLENSRMIDSFRYLHPHEKKFSRLNALVNSRIDYIWVSKKLGSGLIHSDIIEADTITGSDHSIVVTTMLSGIIEKTRSTACNKRLKGKQWVFQLDKAKEEDWENYRTKLDHTLEKKLRIPEENKISQKIEIQDKNLLWDIIASSIINCAKASLPGKKISVGNTKASKLRESNILKKDLRKLGSISQICTKNIGLQIDNLERDRVNTIIANINSAYETDIEYITEEVWIEENLVMFKLW